MLFKKKNRSEIDDVKTGRAESPAISTSDSVVFTAGCFAVKPLLIDKQQEIFTYLKNEVDSQHLVLPKVRLIEFLNPVGDIEFQKKLVVDVQNITSDIIITDDDRNVLVVILVEPATRTAFYEKKLSYVKRICSLVGVSFTVINEVVDIETNDVISEFLKED